MTSDAVDPARFRAVMSRWPTGVSIVTAHESGKDSGLTVNAFLSVSLVPPLVLISLTHDADSTPIIHRTGAFAVNVLAHDQRALSEKFARAIPAHEKFDGISVHRDPGPIALIDGSLAALQCRVIQEFPLADHQLFVGEVSRIEEGRDTAPLVFFRSRYAESDGAGELRLPPPSR
ncbi:MAG: flavin reductase family protein [Thermoplasmata archaeon]|nr:flavin reductase family protein [Thermoplasmata archaeon]